MNEGEIATRLGLAGIPAVAEVIMVERDLRLVELTGARYHVAHISTAAAIEAVRRAKARGLPVTAEAAPHHFALNELEVEGYRTFAKVSPPLRAEDDRRAVVAGLADGTIDVIASDHCPQDQDSKRLPFAQAEFGAVGLETLLPVSLQLVHDGALGLLELLGQADPARRPSCSGLEAGRLRKGAPADWCCSTPRRRPGSARRTCGACPRTRRSRAAWSRARCCAPWSTAARSTRRRRRERAMCRNIRTLFNFEWPATDDEIRAASLQFVRKLSGFHKPSQANEAAFDRAVDSVAATARKFLDALTTQAPPRNRDVAAVKARARSAERFGRTQRGLRS